MFERILRELLATTPGAIGAIVLDREGESVQFWTDRIFDIGPDGLRAVGAYQGIYLADLKRICDRVGAGALERFAIDFDNSRVLTSELRDGYYVVLIMEPSANEGVAWHRLAAAHQRLLGEL